MMMISTKGRYALGVMVYLSEQNTNEYIPLKDIAAQQEISQKYLESIMTVLSKAGLVNAHQGKGGGYKLNRDSREYTVGSILKLTEGTLAPVSCLEHEVNKCDRASKCRTLPMWTQLDSLINEYLGGITLADLAKDISVGDYVI